MKYAPASPGSRGPRNDETLPRRRSDCGNHVFVNVKAELLNNTAAFRSSFCRVGDKKIFCLNLLST
jgi:hypothetical protein